MDLQQRSVIRYYVLRHKYNYRIQAKLCLIYSKYALCPRIVDAWPTRFQSKRTSVEDDERPGRPSRDDFSVAIFDYLKRNPHASCHEIAKRLFVPRITILRALGKMDFRFFITRWVPHELSAELKAKRVEICKKMLEVLEESDPRQQNHIIMGDKLWIYWDTYHHGQWTADRGAMSPRIHTTISSEMIIFSIYFTRHELISIEALPKGERSNFIFFTLIISQVSLET
jgi:hypothetical protein